MTVDRIASGEGNAGEVTRIAEEFIRLREAGEATDLDAFCAEYPEGLRAAMRSECIQLLRIHRVIKQPDRSTVGQLAGTCEVLSAYRGSVYVPPV